MSEPAPLVLVAALVLAGGAGAQPDVQAILRGNQAATGAPPASAAGRRAVYAFAGFGMTGRYVYTDDLRDGRFVDALSVGPVEQDDGFDGRRAWLKEPSGAVTPQDGGDERGAAVSEAYRNAELWWRSDRGGARITTLGARRDAGGAFDGLTVAPRDGAPFDAWFDADTHLLARTVQVRGARTVTVSFSNYRRIDGVMQAGTTTIDAGDGPKAVQTMTLGEVAYLPSLDPAMFAAPKTGLADASIAGGAPQTALPIRLVDNRPYAEVSVDGKGPVLFILDTGANNTLYAPLARTLGLDVQGRAAQQGAGEGTVDAGFAKVADLAIGAARIKNQVVAVEPDDLADVEGLGDQGILGFETFRRFVVRIDYGRGVLTLIAPDRFDPKDAGTPLHFDFEGDYVEVAGRFEGLPVRLIVDTGSRAAVVLNKPFVQRNHLIERHPRGLDAVAGWGTGGPAYAYATRGASLAVGPISIRDVVTFFSTQETGAFAGSDFDGEIGGGVLKRFVVTFDYARQTMYLKPASPPPTDIGTFDRAGMWFNRSPAGFVIVDVTRGSPAARAGLKPGDEIVDVGQRSARRLDVWDLRRRLRDQPPGSAMTFRIRRDGRLHTAVVRLRNLI